MQKYSSSLNLTPELLQIFCQKNKNGGFLFQVYCPQIKIKIHSNKILQNKVK